MHLTCLCPTYRRPRLLENAIACFEAQDYPLDSRRLLILEDAGELQAQEGSGWVLQTTGTRCRSLPGKYNDMAASAMSLWPDTEAFVVLDDDDIYLPWHLSAHAAALASMPRGWSHPAFVLTDGSGGGPARELRPEPTGFARLHGGLAISRKLFEDIGGWIETLQADFDLQMLAKLKALRAPQNPCRFYPPSYVFRWATTGYYHYQAHLEHQTDENLWGRLATMPSEPRMIGLVPQFDDETARTYQKYATR